MLKKIFFYGLLAAGSLGLGACTTLPVTTDVNPHYSVANCRSYVFAQEHVANVDQPAAFGNPLNADRLRAAIEANIAARGVQRVSDRAAADCVVGYAMGTRQVFDDYYAGWGVGWGYGWGRRGYGWGGWGYDGPWVTNETRIAVDVFDAKSNKPIWHAAVSQTMYDLTGPKAQAKIQAATAAIFTKFPVVASQPLPAAAPPPAAAAAAAPTAASAGRIFMYPKNGQSEAQQAADRQQCEQWATQQAASAGDSAYQRAMAACVEARGYTVK
jgi:Domain of unknown function (DUF4136)